jgi:hypothetical protein
MVLNFWKTLVLLAVLVSSVNLYAQKASYSNECDLVHDFLRVAETDFALGKLAVDTTIIILDVDYLLKDCPITVAGNLKLHIVDTGTEIEGIRKGGIFKAYATRPHAFVLVRFNIVNRTLFGLYHARTNRAYD